MNGKERPRTTSQNLNPRSTSSLGYLTPGNVSSQISRAIAWTYVSQINVAVMGKRKGKGKGGDFAYADAGREGRVS
jgi:hypothetical protein